MKRAPVHIVPGASGGIGSTPSRELHAPGLVRTPLAERITGNASALAASTAMHPIGRIGEADEVARLAAFLLDPRNAWMTGAVHSLDGGLAALRGRS